LRTRDGFIAVTRFGLGAKPGELDQAGRDPHGWLKRQISATPETPRAFAGFATGGAQMREFQKARQLRGDAGAQKLIRASFRETYLTEAAARLRVQVDSVQPFRERLVAFWSNHFTVSVQRPPVFGLAGAFEREAIRPHVTGRFQDMLRAVARHPAMLVYLDNGQSIGPNSTAGLRRGRGLNENLAREILELHTLGVDGGYTQTDVREFAKILTGWTVGRFEDSDAGHFHFFPIVHEPGAKTLLGVRYAERGEGEGEAALLALSRHPATAQHIARKLARHFIADEPPAAAVHRLAEIFRATDGNLRAVTEALIEQPEAWADPLAKVKAPNDFVVSALRATGFEGQGEMVLGALRMLGQPPFAAPSPAGWPDTASQWIGPESIMRRAEWAMALGLRVAEIRAPDQIFDETIAPVADRATERAVRRAPSKGDALALVFASPAFQMR